MLPTRPAPVAVWLCAVAALVFAFPTLGLPADTPTGVKGVFILVGSVLFVVGVIRMRYETRPPNEPSER